MRMERTHPGLAPRKAGASNSCIGVTGSASARSETRAEHVSTEIGAAGEPLSCPTWVFAGERGGGRATSEGPGCCAGAAAARKQRRAARAVREEKARASVACLDADHLGLNAHQEGGNVIPRSGVARWGSPSPRRAARARAGAAARRRTNVAPVQRVCRSSGVQECE